MMFSEVIFEYENMMFLLSCDVDMHSSVMNKMMLIKM